VSRKFSTLFSPRSHARVYPTLRAELDAVRAGRKAIAMEIWPAGDSLADDPDHASLVRLARARGLEIVYQPDTGRSGVPIVAVYALRAAQAWRIPALHALWRAFPQGGEPWSDGAEALEGHLLGYSRSQIAAWLAARRHERLGWRGVTIYLVGRSLEAVAGTTAVWAAGTRVIKRRPPAWLAREGLQLARIAITERAFARTFPARGDVRTVRLAAKHAQLVRARISRIELLGRDGWRDAMA
jgi:hypothetical protein